MELNSKKIHSRTRVPLGIYTKKMANKSRSATKVQLFSIIINEKQYQLKRTIKPKKNTMRVYFEK